MVQRYETCTNVLQILYIFGLDPVFVFNSIDPVVLLLSQSGIPRYKKTYEPSVLRNTFLIIYRTEQTGSCVIMLVYSLCTI